MDSWLVALNILCSIAGIAFFSYSAVLIRKIREMFPMGSVNKKWGIVQILVLFFLLGYVVNITFVLLGEMEIVLFMGALVYLFGGFFVFFIISLGLNTYKTIMDLSGEE